MARKKNLERAVVLGLILSTGVYGSAWAAEGPINDDNWKSYENKSYNSEALIENNSGTEAAIKLENADDVTIKITTNGKYDITLNSDGSGIRTQEDSNGGSITLNAGKDNYIKFSGEGNGIDADSNLTITLKAAGNNKILSAENAGEDGVNLGEHQSGKIQFTAGNSNVIKVTHDGIYTNEDSTADSEYIAESGNNEIESGNNGIDHRGSGDIILKAEKGQNIITADGGDGIRVEGPGTVEFIAQNNKITAGDNGIQISGSGTVNVTAKGGSNIIKAGNNGIDIAKGTGNITANVKNDITAGSTGINVFGDSNAYIDGKETTITVVKNIPDSSPTADMAAGINLGEKVNEINTYGNLILGTNEGIKNNKLVIDVTNNNNSKVSSTIGINMSLDSTLRTENEIGDVSITATNVNGGKARGISVAGSTFDVSVNSFNITAESGINSQSNATATGISATNNANVEIDSANEIIINAENKQNVSNFYKNTMAIDANKSNVYLDSGSDIVLNYIKNKDDVQQLVSEINKLETGINVGQQGSVVLTSQNINEINAIDGIVSTGANPVQEGGSTEEAKGAVILNAENANNINAKQFGIDVDGQNQGENAARVELNAKQNNIYIYADTGASTYGKGIEASYNGIAKIGNHNKRAEITNIVVKNINTNTYALRAVDATYSSNIDIDSDIINLIVDDSEVKLADSKFSYGIYSQYYSNVDFDADKINMDVSNGKGIYAWADATVDFNANEIYLTSNDDTIYAEFGSRIILNSDSIFVNTINGDGIYAATEWNNKENIVALTAENTNVVRAGNFDVIKFDGKDTILGYGDLKAINALSAGQVLLGAGNVNSISGAVYAAGTDTSVNVKGLEDNYANNYVYSAAVIDGAGDLAGKETIKNPETGKEEVTGMDVVSSLYAEEGAEIKLSGVNNIRTYYDDPKDDHTSERAVWAYKGADITIDGNTTISTSSYESSPNDMDIAVVAGTATGLENLSLNDILNYDTIVGKRASVKVNYESDSSITGDILSAYGGEVNITPNSTTTRAASDAKINIHGNLLAGNNGKLTVDLGKGGSLTGRADDYGDAGLNTGHGAVDSENSFFNPAFSSEIKANGTVNLTMGVGSRWDVTGQSWITSLTTTGNAEDTLISLEKAKEDLNSNASALTIGTLKGDTRFYMNLDGDRSASDMLYIKNAQGVNGETAQYDIYLQEEVTSGEINAGGFNGLRFATVGEGSKANFTVRSQGTGSAFDVEYEVDTDSYVNNSENSDYNSTTGGDANVEKPGDDSVNDFFGVSDNNGTEAAVSNDIMLLDETTDEGSELDEVTNFKIVARKGEEISDTGKTILNMSRANYSNAIYMDRLNKRLGEARYINSEEDEGMWVRIRHDRIGKDDAYRSQNTMYELGYDQKQECDNGERRVGMAIDYMHGDTGYDQIAGKGEIDRYGLWLYDTWMGDKGHYADYVAKWGHLSNDFEVYTMNDKTKQVTGDYSNNVFSVSAEYGRKKDIGNDWYFEPQVQAQLARVTGADYTTNQGTKVSVDGINSLIGRAGFRLGKDFGEEKQSTVYIKADVLHEFLGDQDVRVLDKSSDNKWAGISYENEGTWYDVGFGFATQMSKNSYAFMDFEKSFGNDNDETYQINVGMQWSF